MAISLKDRMRIKPVPCTAEEQAQRLAICAECPHAVLTVAGSCDTCRLPQVTTGQADGELGCKRTRCAGTVRGREVPRCGACGCPLASRTKYKHLPGVGPVRCPKGKW